jgi:long-chain acyl-CoA synthetase
MMPATVSILPDGNAMIEQTLPAVHRRQAERLGPRTAIRQKRYGLYHDLPWDEYREQVTACASALVHAGIEPGDRVSVFAENRIEWLVADMAILEAGAIHVPLHAPLTGRQAHYQLADAGVSWVFVSGPGQYAKLSQVRSELPAVHGVVLFDDHPTDEENIPWHAFLQMGRNVRAAVAAELQRRQAAMTADTLATIMYTSGTTGNPKGVMLSHGNLLSNAEAFTAAAPPPPDCVFLSWLPFSHIYARTVDIYGNLVSGSIVALAESADTLVLNLAEIRPHMMSAVPRFYEKVLGAVQADPKTAKARLRAIFGPRIDWLSSGGAPLPPAVANAYKEAGLLVLQGYGLTESSPVISFNRKDRYKLDSVGLAIPGVEVKIAPDGEILTRGPHVMKGYWKDPQGTAQTIKDGWLHTGDLGRIDEDGFLSITGRKKELMVLSNGKKVVPNYIEGLLLADPCIDQVVVCGEGRSYLTALIVPNWPNLCRAVGMDPGRGEDALSSEPKVLAFLDQRVQQAVTDVSPWEQVKKIAILPQPFSVANEEMTVSLKLRRGVIAARHRDEIEGMYRDGADEVIG